MAISEAQIKSILEDLQEGSSLRKACSEADASATLFLRLVDEDQSLQEQYAHARKVGYSMRADELEAVAADLSIPADHKRIMVDTRKWMLSKMLPKIYGDRLNLEHSGKVSADTMTEAELTAIAAKGRGG